jgi:hypothetical protein
MDEEILLVSSVPRALEMKSRLFGFELTDLLLIFLTLSLTNLAFGGSSYRYLLVWAPTTLLAGTLFFIKRGRPDNYLQHLIEFLAKPSYRAAGAVDPTYRRFRLKKELV